MSECNATPISFLLLERYLLEEVSVEERTHVQAHLSECEACRACFDSLRNDATPLMPMPKLIGLARLRRGIKPLPAAVAMASMAALMLFLVRLGQPSQDSLAVNSPTSHGTGDPSGVKGGELAIDLVRAHGTEIGVDPTQFVVGDHFAVRVTCDPSQTPYWDVVVFQGDEASFPLSPTSRVHCGNHVTLPGAFALTEEKMARVCVMLSQNAPIERARVTPKLSKDSVCTEIRAVSAPPLR